MKIAIHCTENTFKWDYSKTWIKYCQENLISYKIVNAFDTDIISQLSDCDIFMWHYSQEDPRAMNVAKQILFALQQKGMTVFPDFNTGWHFDDKLGQKYLFESFNIDIAPTYVFFDKDTAIKWAKNTSYPKVFKLRSGSGSFNVSMVKSYSSAKKYIKKAFGSGFKSFSRIVHFKHRILEFLRGTTSFYLVMCSFYRLFIPTQKVKLPKHREYVYFQEFIENDGFDYRVEVCGDKCIAMIRYCRNKDFRASGGHNDHFEKELIAKDVIFKAFEIADKLGLQSAALDFIREKNTGKLYLVENSYCYGVDNDEFEHGYWDKEGDWHNEKFNGIYWMIEMAIRQYEETCKGCSK